MEKIQPKYWVENVSGYYKTKKRRKKVAWTTMPLGGGGEAKP